MDNYAHGFRSDDGGPYRERVFRYRDWYMELPEPLPVIMNYIFMATLKKNAKLELDKKDLTFESYTMYAADHPENAVLLEYATMNELISEREFYKNSPLEKLEVSNKVGKHTVKVVIDHPFTGENPLQ